ncbi:MAG: cadmium-translocating P-type ATPase [Methanobrevibacter thaueri]|nr:cadmium-translocating P-type ATPase [Methanobrevibacter thaueri]
MIKMKLTKTKKIKLINIIISITSLIGSYLLPNNTLSWIAIALCGIPIIKESIEKLITEFDIKADLLVSIAIISSLIIGEIFAAGEIATIMAIGGFLEDYTVSKTHEKIEKLVKITPQTATRIKNKKEEKIPVEKIKIGDILKVLPGENIPTDGIIIDGKTSIDQSTLTGESIPVDKKENEKIYSGTINLYGSFTMKATKIVEDSSIQKLIKLVESSSPENAKIVRQADKWAALIVAIAFTTSILTYLLTFEIIRSVTILVVFCPCALVLATPTAIMAAIGNLTKYGILIKDGASLEELGHISELIFDKTGTLTHGTPQVINIISDNPKEMMYLLTSLESKSEHPIAKAIVKHNESDELAEVKDFKIHMGMGITGIINNSKIIAGNKQLLKTQNIIIKDTKPTQNGEIEIFVAKNTQYIGKIILADTLRENSKEMIKNLKQMRIKTSLLTGDNEETAKHIADKLKIRNHKSNCLPEDKIQYIQEEQIKGHKVAMIGDGINDAPSLKKANVGIAMGKIGSEISIEAADITLITDEIKNIPYLIKMAKNTLKTIKISICFALIINIIAMGLAILGLITPIEGALIHNIGSVIVIIYSANLSRYKILKKDCEKTKKIKLNKNINKSII